MWISLGALLRPRPCRIERHDLIFRPQNYVLLCVSRAVAGIGGGGIVSAVWLITAELVREEQRAKWSQALSVTWSASAVAGKAATPALCIFTTIY